MNFRIFIPSWKVKSSKTHISACIFQNFHCSNLPAEIRLDIITVLEWHRSYWPIQKPLIYQKLNNHQDNISCRKPMKMLSFFIKIFQFCMEWNIKKNIQKRSEMYQRIKGSCEGEFFRSFHLGRVVWQPLFLAMPFLFVTFMRFWIFFLSFCCMFFIVLSTLSNWQFVANRFGSNDSFLFIQRSRYQNRHMTWTSLSPCIFASSVVSDDMRSAVDRDRDLIVPFFNQRIISEDRSSCKVPTSLLHVL